jgi:hypothetical protein
LTDDVEARRLARVVLLGMAERAHHAGKSALEWEDAVIELPEGKLLGAKEVSAIGSLVFLKRRR